MLNRKFYIKNKTVKLVITKLSGRVYEVYFDLKYYTTFKNKLWNVTPITKTNKSQYCYNQTTKKPMHHYILDKKPNLQIDHINRNGLDNRVINLRHATSSENTQNRKSWSKNKLGKGVTKRVFSKGQVRYRARIRKDGTLINIGHFDSAEKARIAYDKKAIEIYGKEAFTNGKL